MRRRKLSKVSFNGKLIVDVIAASLIVQKAPAFISKFVALDPTIQAVAGVGVGYLTGMFLKRPDLANASIGLGAVDFISPMVDNLIGSTNTTPVPVTSMPTTVTWVQPTKTTPTLAPAGLSEYYRLNDYVSSPKQMAFDNYRNSY